MANRVKVGITSSIIVLRQQGWSFRKIAQTLEVHRETEVYFGMQEAPGDPEIAAAAATPSILMRMEFPGRTGAERLWRINSTWQTTYRWSKVHHALGR